MAEFRVDPGQVEGMGRLLERVADNVTAAGDHVGSWATGTEGLTGAMLPIQPLVAAYGTSQVDLLSGWATTLVQSGTATVDAAWAFLNCDSSNTREFDLLNGYPGDSASGGPTPMPGAAPLPGGDAASLSDPAGEDADIQGLIADGGGPLAQVDEKVRWFTGLIGNEWSPVTEAVSPLTGNWGALERAGNALIASGETLGTARGDLAAGRLTVAFTWFGAAAEGFADHVQRFERALEDAGVLQRLVGEVYVQVAPEFSRAAEVIISALNWLVEQVLSRISQSWIPGWSQARWVKFAWDAWPRIQEVIDTIQRIIEVVEQVQALLEVVQDPAGAAQSYVEDQLAPYQEHAETAQRVGGLVADVGALASMDIDDAPTGVVGYQAGAADGR